MRKKKETGGLQHKKVKDFNLQHTVECGQFFRYLIHDKGYYIQLRDKIFYVKQPSKNIISYKGCTSDFITHLFRLDEDYTKIKKILSTDIHTKKAYTNYKGLRLMRQDPWECCISYICSAAANIPKIQLNINLLARNFGKKKRFDNKIFYTFPKPGTLNCKTTIKDCKTGFRTNYLHTINTLLSDKKLQKISLLPYTNAKDELTKMPGIGSKIADCILLFSLGFDEAFPIDVWIRKVMQQLYFKGKDVSDKSILDFASDKWDKHAGYVQEYLYMYARMNALKDK